MDPVQWLPVLCGKQGYHTYHLKKYLMRLEQPTSQIQSGCSNSDSTESCSNDSCCTLQTRLIPGPMYIHYQTIRALGMRIDL